MWLYCYPMHILIPLFLTETFYHVTIFLPHAYAHSTLFNRLFYHVIILLPHSYAHSTLFNRLFYHVTILLPHAYSHSTLFNRLFYHVTYCYPIHMLIPLFLTDFFIMWLYCYPMHMLIPLFLTETRLVCQFHYSLWPDHGVPEAVRPLLSMVKLVRECQASETLPLLVHCSAGCGRTGTICAIDHVWTLLRTGVSVGCGRTGTICAIDHVWTLLRTGVSVGCGRTGTICAIDHVWALLRTGVSVGCGHGLLVNDTDSPCPHPTLTPVLSSAHTWSMTQIVPVHTPHSPLSLAVPTRGQWHR